MHIAQYTVHTYHTGVTFVETNFSIKSNKSIIPLTNSTFILYPQAWNLHEFTEMLLAHDASIPMVAANAVVLYNSSHNSEHLKRFVR